LVSCTEEDENTQFIPPEARELTDENDIYLKQHMLDKFGTAVRWRWESRFVDDDQNATPIHRDYVVPVTKMIDYLWVGPYIALGETSEQFIRELFPSEMVYIGSFIFETDGSVLLGTADAGTRVTLLNLNNYDLTDRNWLTNPGGGVLSTIHHEFSHIVHQNYGMPAGFNTISEKYTGAGWINMDHTDLAEAISMGMVSNYGTSDQYEDFCEITSHFLTLPADVFAQTYLLQESLDGVTDPAEIARIREMNEGRIIIQQKLQMIIDLYRNKLDIDLVALRDTLGSRIDYVVTNNEIPE
jgi:substrate import-associated zinc metallohydrolase lipoprotein